MSGLKVGIDLGTTYSAISYVDANNTPQIIETDYGELTTPSVVAVTPRGFVVGQAAKEIESNGAEGVFSGFKRHMGSDAKFLAFDKYYTPVQLSTELLRHIKRIAEKESEQKIESAVITCPAYFDQFQREATRKAGEDAGLNVIDLVNEPTAASIYYGLKKSASGTIMTYDLGGGTFDVTILRFSGDDIKVIGTKGDSKLGGKDWDRVIYGIMYDRYTEETDDYFDDVATECGLMVQAENVKHQLSKSASVKTSVVHAGKKVVVTVDRDEFETLSKPLVSSTMDVCESLLDDLDMEWSDLDHILLIGGSTRLPAVRRMVKERSGIDVIIHEDTDVAVAKGAALLANASAGSVVFGVTRTAPNQASGLSVRTFRDVTGHGLGTLVTDADFTKYLNQIMIERNSPIPASSRRRFQIPKHNKTDHLDVYVIQGESEYPLDSGNRILNMYVAKGLDNDGKGLEIDIDFKYDNSGMVQIEAFQGKKSLLIEKGTVPEDVSWMGRPPVAEVIDIRQEKYIILALDMSGSMYGKPMKEAIDAMKGFVRDLADDMFAVVLFSDRVMKLHGFESSDATRSALDTIPNYDTGAGTNANPITHPIMEELLNEALERTQGIENSVFVVTLTDGEWYGAGCDPSSKVQEYTRKGAGCIGIGFGHVSKEMIRKLSSTDASALKANYGGLKSTFSAIASNINSGYRIN